MPLAHPLKLPIGLQLVGRWHEDAFLLDVAHRLEAALASPGETADAS